MGKTRELSCHTTVHYEYFPPLDCLSRSSIHAREKSTLHILALVPMVQGNETTLPVENWRRGWGANLAVDMINNDSTILQDTFLKLSTINSNADDSFASLVDFVRVSTNRESIAIIGMFFDKETEIFSPLAVNSISVCNYRHRCP